MADPRVYLQPDFDPSIYKVPELRSALLAQGIALPSTARKPDLVDAFIKHIRPKAADLLTKQARVRPNGAGIIDARVDMAVVAETSAAAEGSAAPDTPSAGTKRGRGRPRRTIGGSPSTSLSALEAEAQARWKEEREQADLERESEGGDEEDDEDVVEEQPPVKRSRGRPRKTAPAALPPEESEMDTPQKPTRKKSAAARPSPPPASTSRALLQETESAFSDYNPFQSGGEGSSPGYSTKNDRRKTSLAPRQSTNRRHSELPTPISRIALPRATAFDSPVSPDDTPSRPPAQARVPPSAPTPVMQRYMVPLDSLRTSASTSRPTPAPAPVALARRVSSPLKPAPAEEVPEHPSELEPDPDDEFEPVDNDELNELMKERAAAEEHNRHVEGKLALSERPRPNVHAPQDAAAVVRRPSAIKRVGGQDLARGARNFSLFALVLVVLAALLPYKTQSASIGYCDTGSSTNAIAAERQIALVRARDALARGESVEDAPVFLFMPQPTACAPCPPHAKCAGGEIIGCSSEYKLRPNLLSALPLVDRLLNGLPGLGPVALPTACTPDNEKRELVADLAGQVAKRLERWRGDVECGRVLAAGKTELEKYGLSERTLWEDTLDLKDPSFDNTYFREIWDLALKDLKAHGDVEIGPGSESEGPIIAAKNADLTLACRAKKAAYASFERWRSQLVGFLVVLAGLGYGKKKVEQSHEESQRVAELVDVALQKLQDRETAHYVDPAQTPYPYLSPAHLRDLVLAREHSPARRQRLWARVAKIVEGNANVQTRQAESRGEISDVWEWRSSL